MTCDKIHRTPALDKLGLARCCYIDIRRFKS
jgi:hypothetical protein